MGVHIRGTLPARITRLWSAGKGAREREGESALACGGKLLCVWCVVESRGDDVSFNTALESVSDRDLLLLPISVAPRLASLCRIYKPGS